MKDNVRIRVIGTYNTFDENDSDNTTFSPETTELITTGSWYQKNGKDYILYTDRELVEDIDTHTRVTFDGDQVSIVRQGGSDTHLVFKKESRHISPYQTPFGFLEMISYTHDIHINKSEESLDLSVTYSLELSGSDMGTNIFHIVVERL